MPKGLTILKLSLKLDRCKHIYIMRLEKNWPSQRSQMSCFVFWTLQTHLQLESDSPPLNGYFPQSLLLFEETDSLLYWTEQAWVNDSSYLWLQRHFKTFLIMIKWHKTYYLGNQRKVLSYHTWKEFPSTVSKNKQNTLVPIALFEVLCQKHSYFIARVLTKVENYQWTPKEKSYQTQTPISIQLNQVPRTKQ